MGRTPPPAARAGRDAARKGLRRAQALQDLRLALAAGLGVGEDLLQVAANPCAPRAGQRPEDALDVPFFHDGFPPSASSGARKPSTHAAYSRQKATRSRRAASPAGVME